MIIYFVRHGHPDYKNDCLTPLGKKQAEKAAEVISALGINEIYASTKGRALETAEPTAKILGLPVIPCDFMREITWESLDGEPVMANGHPWDIANAFAAEGMSLADPDWRNKEPFSKCALPKSVDKVIKGFDGLLAELGYTREGDYYRVTGENTDKTIAIFSHAGSSSAVISHLLNVPFPQLVGFFSVSFTSITKISLSGKKGQLVLPKLKFSNEAKHIEGITVDNVYGN